MNFRVMTRILGHFELVTIPLGMIALAAYILLFHTAILFPKQPTTDDDANSINTFWNDNSILLVISTTLAFVANFVLAVFLIQTTIPVSSYVSRTDPQRAYTVALTRCVVGGLEFSYFFIFFLFMGHNMGMIIIVVIVGIPLTIVLGYLMEIKHDIRTDDMEMTG